MDTLPTIAAARLRMNRHFMSWRRGPLRTLFDAWRAGSTIAARAIVLRVAAALLIAFVGICERPEGQAGPDREIRAGTMAPIASDHGPFTLVAVIIDIADDGVDIHQALRGPLGCVDLASAPPTARLHADPLARTGLFLPERPPRIA